MKCVYLLFIAAGCAGLIGGCSAGAGLPALPANDEVPADVSGESLASEEVQAADSQSEVFGDGLVLAIATGEVSANGAQFGDEPADIKPAAASVSVAVAQSAAEAVEPPSPVEPTSKVSSYAGPLQAGEVVTIVPWNRPGGKGNCAPGRAQPNQNSAMNACVFGGESVTVVTAERSDGWAKVQTAVGDQFWIYYMSLRRG